MMYFFYLLIYAVSILIRYPQIIYGVLLFTAIAILLNSVLYIIYTYIMISLPLYYGKVKIVTLKKIILFFGLFYICHFIHFFVAVIIGCICMDMYKTDNVSDAFKIFLSKNEVFRLWYAVFYWIFFFGRKLEDPEPKIRILTWEDHLMQIFYYIVFQILIYKFYGADGIGD